MQGIYLPDVLVTLAYLALHQSASAINQALVQMNELLGEMTLEWDQHISLREVSSRQFKVAVSDESGSEYKLV